MSFDQRHKADRPQRHLFEVIVMSGHNDQVLLARRANRHDQSAASGKLLQ